MRGREAMLKLFGQLKGDDDYAVSEDEMNELGLRLLYDRKDVGAAVEVLKLNPDNIGGRRMLERIRNEKEKQ